MQFPPRSGPLTAPGGFAPNCCLHWILQLFESQGWGTSKENRHTFAPFVVVTTFILTRKREKKKIFVSTN